MKYFLICIYGLALSLPLVASTSKTQKLGLFEGISKGKSSIVWDLGFSANAILSDLSDPLTGLGLGNQTALSFNFATNQERGLKLIFQQLKAKQSNFRNTKFQGNLIRSLEQEWNFFGIGVETRKQNRLITWYWDGVLGYAFGKDSRIVSQGESLNDSLIISEEPTRSFVYVSAAAGIRQRLTEKWLLNANLRTYAILGSVYGDQLKSKTLLLLPLQVNLGAEYSF